MKLNAIQKRALKDLGGFLVLAAVALFMLVVFILNH
jgi:hypothetical protein